MDSSYRNNDSSKTNVHEREKKEKKKKREKRERERVQTTKRGADGSSFDDSLFFA